MSSENHCPYCEGRLENPPKGWDEGFRRLIWNLREYGFPITRRSMDILRDHIEKLDKEVEDLEYDIVAQSISQSYNIDFETNNSVCDRHYLESHGINTEELSDVGVQLAIEDFIKADHA